MTDHYHDDSPDAPTEVERALRSHTTATVQFGTATENLKYVLDADAQPIAPATRSMLGGADVILLIPEQTQIEIEAMVTPLEIDPDSAEADRWRIYHGEPPSSLFARFFLEALSYGTHVVDGEAFSNLNPLAACEAALCREMNQTRRRDLQALTRHFAHVEVAEPLLVGVDAFGFDIRANLGIIRIPAPQTMANEKLLRQTLAEMIGRAQARATPSAQPSAETPPS